MPPPANVHILTGDMDPHLSRGTHESAPRKASRSVIPFLQVLPLCSTHTDKQIDRQTSADHGTRGTCNNRQYLCDASDAS